MQTSDLDGRVSELSPKKRELLEKLLRQSERMSCSAEYVAPESPRQSVLAAVWTNVLAVERIGIHDNYFELGGDSIQAIRIVARSRQAGLLLSTTDLFNHPTIAELARVAQDAGEPDDAEDDVDREVPLTPIQRWFFDLEIANPNHWNQAVLLEVAAGTDAAAWEAAAMFVARRHAALRLRFERSGRGWIQKLVSDASPVAFRLVSLRHLEAERQLAEIDAEAERAQREMNISSGALVQLRLFDLGEGRPARLLIAVHHLVIDGVSFRILVEEIEAVYHLFRARGKVSLPPATSSFVKWARLLAEYSSSAELHRDEAWWASAVACDGRLPVDDASGENTEGTARTFSQTISAEDTRELIQSAVRGHRASVNDVLLAALAEAISTWCNAEFVRIDVEGHGRDLPFPGVELSRTVGWFTAIYPVRLPVAPGSGLLDRLESVKKEFRRMPGSGTRYGILRWLSDGVSVSEQTRPDLVFNYLGEFDSTLAGSSLLRRATESCGAFFAPEATRPYALQVTAQIVAGRLEVSWNYSPNLHRPERIEQIAQRYMHALRGLVAGGIDAGRLRTSDFPDAELSQDELDRLLENG